MSILFILICTVARYLLVNHSSLNYTLLCILVSLIYAVEKQVDCCVAYAYKTPFLAPLTLPRSLFARVATYLRQHLLNTKMQQQQQQQCRQQQQQQHCKRIELQIVFKIASTSKRSTENIYVYSRDYIFNERIKVCNILSLNKRQSALPMRNELDFQWGLQLTLLIVAIQTNSIFVNFMQMQC